MPKIVYEADLKTGGYDRGAENIERRSERMISAANRVQLAFRHFEHGNVSQGMGQIGRAAGQVGTRFAEMGAQVATAGRKIVGALSGGLSILRSYVGYGTLITTILGGVAAKLTILDSAKFESTVGRAAIQADASPAERAELVRHAYQGAARSPFSLQDFAGAEMAEAQRGRNVSEIIKLTDATANFAMVANGDLKTAAETLSQVMFQFGLPMEKAQETALRLSNAVGVTSLDLNDLFEALQFAGGAAGTFKVNLTEMLAVLGTLRSVAGTSVASTALRNIMLVSSKLGNKSKKNLAALGLDEEDIAGTTFMSGAPKSIMDVVAKLHELAEARPESLMKMGFETRTIVALKQIMDMKDRIEQARVKIDDLDAANRRVAETVDLADNAYHRLETTAGMVMIAIGSKIREAFSVDEGVKDLGDQVARIAETIAAIPKQNVHEIVDSLGAGLLQAFSTAITFVAESLMHVATHFGAALIQGGIAALGVATASDETKSYLSQYSKMNPAQRTAEQNRLAGILGLKEHFSEDDAENLQNLGNALFMSGGHVANIRRAWSIAHITNPSVAGADELRLAIANLQEAAGNAMQSLSVNPTVQAVGHAMEAGRAAQTAQAVRDALDRISGIGFSGGNHGIINNYGASSPGARAAPSRPSGTLPQERATR